MFILVDAILEDNDTGTRSRKAGIVVEVDDVNDVAWAGGETGDEFFDSLEDDFERLTHRIQDCVEFQFDDQTIVDFTYLVKDGTEAEIITLNRSR